MSDVEIEVLEFGAVLTPSDSGDGAEGTEGDEGQAVAGKENPKKRFILFIGNLPFDATDEDVRMHFAKAEPSSVRFLTKRTGQSKGCCFVDFASAAGMKIALQRHHSKIKGRRINVEVTCGGGGRKEERRSRIQKKNQEMREAWKKKAQKRKVDSDSGKKRKAFHHQRGSEKQKKQFGASGQSPKGSAGAVSKFADKHRATSDKQKLKKKYVNRQFESVKSSPSQQIQPMSKPKAHLKPGGHRQLTAGHKANHKHHLTKEHREEKKLKHKKKKKEKAKE